MTQEEIQKFKYDNKALLPCDRQELIKEHLQKAIALLDVEIVIQAMYSQMDYGTLNTTSYKTSKELCEKALKEVKFW